MCEYIAPFSHLLVLLDEATQKIIIYTEKFTHRENKKKV